MKRDTQIGNIKAPLFVVGLVTLLLNDFYLKYSFSNELTGKLSDVAGLFIFPYFFSSVKPQYRKIIYWATAFAFIGWKSSFSQSLIDFGNSIGIGFHRTIDYSDLFTLLILPLSYRYFTSISYQSFSFKSPVVAILAIASLFSFTATTLPRQEVKLEADTDRSFVLDMSKEEFFNRISPAHGYSNALHQNLNDSLFYLYFYLPELKADVTALASITNITSDKVVILLDSVISSYVTGGLFSGVDQKDMHKLESLNSNQLEDYFYKYFIDKVRSGAKGNHLYYDNKVIHDSYGKNE
ncbi:hypothetical protein MKJ04_06485 [Pontibacter sp. E15-1]|uniref:hypothetical protein n=1 Tax=Pontibacter sp. E15-1 TaxID=2919918 RepID=UPI001F4FB089|nr:hypothetical protein [Pontibacter sp. E15-1]MCJ8164487.1 hypothetical protein [Pontibacter sp. E15-1]